MSLAEYEDLRKYKQLNITLLEKDRDCYLSTEIIYQFYLHSNYAGKREIATILSISSIQLRDRIVS